MKRGCLACMRGCVPPRVSSPAATPFLRERVSNLTSPSALSQLDASWAFIVNSVTKTHQ